MEGSRARPLPRCAVESRRRRSRRPGRPRGRAARRLRLSDRIVSLLAGSTAPDRLCSRTIRRELYDRRIARRCRVHRRPLSDRQRAVRGHATSRYLLSRRHSDERAPDAGIADIERTTRVLLPRAAGRRGRPRRRDPEGGRGEGANDRRGDQRPPLFAQSCARSTGARVADRGAFARMALVVRGATAEPHERQCGTLAGCGCTSDCARISAACGGSDRSGVRGRPLDYDAEPGHSAAANSDTRPVRGPASATRRQRPAALSQLLTLGSPLVGALSNQREDRTEWGGRNLLAGARAGGRYARRQRPARKLHSAVRRAAGRAA